MYALRSGKWPSSQARRLPRCLFVPLTLVLAGCAPSGPPEIWNLADPQRVVANAPRPRVDLEADGLPAQTPPLRREASEPDDPSEPFSPNYGPRPAPAPAMKAAARPRLPDA